MTETLVNRRREPRRYCLDTPLTWQALSRPRRNPGELDNISASGLAFDTPRKTPLRPGRMLELVCKADRAPMLCRVLRVVARDDGGWRVHCQRLSPDASTARLTDRPPSGRARVRLNASTTTAARLAA